MDIIQNLIDQIEQQYPDVTCSLQENEHTIIFFNKHGLPRLSVVIKSIFGLRINVDLFDYDKKLT